MAFNINAHVILSGPKNIKAVTKSIQQQLGTVNAKINLQAPKNLSKQLGAFNKGISSLNKSISTLQASATSANTHLSKLGGQFRSLNKSSSQMSRSQSHVQKSLDKTGKAVGEVRNEIQAFGKDAALAIRRFSAFTVATGVVFGFVRAVQSATKAAIDYEREVVKIVQVTGASANQIKGLNATIKELSVSLGVDANELAELSRMFAQTGQSIDQVRHSINAVAKSSLAPTFGRMKDTAEGLIAAMAQFGIAAEKQEAILSSLNAVSKKFAVESEDLISVIRRAGGVFAASRAGFEEPIEGLQQLIGIFTAVRSTTRESADTIAVGLRTIFTRIQRRGTIEFLKQFNIELVDTKGNFIGLFPAFQQLSKGLDSIIKSGDALTLSAITEELGGVRQVGKLIPAITQFNKALEATKIAGEAAKKGLGKDVALALQPLGKQFELLQQRFSALIRDITQSKTFQNMAKVALSLGNAFLSVAETLKPLLPMLATLATIKISKGLFEFGKGFVGGLTKGGGAGGMGGALGSAVTGGGGGGSSGGAARSLSVQQALNSALKNNSTLLTNNNTALKQLGTQVVSNTTAINNVGGKVTPVIGAIGNLINALNRSSLGGGFGGGFGGGRRGPRKFARGGYVSGPSHAQGGVPAILEGGEYVIPKGYAAGSVVSAARRQGKFKGKKGKGERGFATASKDNPLQFSVRPGKIGGFFLEESGGNDPRSFSFKDKPFKLQGKLAQATGQGSNLPAVLKGGKLSGFFPSKKDVKQSLSSVVKSETSKSLGSAVTKIAEAVRSQNIVDIPPINGNEEELKRHASARIASDKNAVNSMAGFVFEGIVQALTGATLAGEGANFDFPNASLRGNKSRLGALFGASSSIASLAKADAKASWGLRDTIPNKIINDINAGNLAGVLMQKTSKRSAGATDRARKAKGRAAGGTIFAPQGTDTVPAMLTPGEFVINRKSAEKFGYGNLKKINRYAKGGVAATGNVQYLAGGSGGGFGAGIDTKNASSKVERLLKTFNLLDQQIADTADAFMKGDKTYEQMIQEVDKLQDGLMKTNKSLGKEWVGKQKQGSAPGLLRAMGSPKAKAADTIHRARQMDTFDPSKAAAAEEAAKKASQEATEKATEKMEALTSVVGHSVGAIGGFTAAISSFDMSSPQAALSSIMSLSFAVSEATTAMSALSKLTKIGAASEAAETAANVAATATEARESVASAVSAKTEWDEVKANLASARSEGMKGGKSLLEDMFGRRSKGLKSGKGMIGGMEKMLRKVLPKGVGKTASGVVAKASKGLLGASKMLVKFAPALGKIATGGVIGGIAAALVAPIGNAIADLALGKKEEIAPGVVGRRGVNPTTAGATAAGIGGASGAAGGAGLGAAIGSIIPGIGTAIGAAIGAVGGAAVGGVMGFVKESLAQEQFNAFVKLQDSSAQLSKTFAHLSKLGDDVGEGALEKVNQDVSAALNDTIDALHITERKGVQDATLGFGNAIETMGSMSGINPAKALNNQSQMANIGSEGFMSSIGNMFDQLSSNLIGNWLGGEDRTKQRARMGQGKITGDALVLAADQIKPEDLQAMDDAIQSMLGNFITNMASLEDVDALQALAEMDPIGDLDTGQDTAAKNSAKLDAAFNTLGNTLKGAEGGTAGFAKQLDKLIVNSLKMHMIKDVAEEIKVLKEIDPAKAKELGASFHDLDTAIGDWDQASMTDIKTAINELGGDKDAKKKLLELAEARQQEAIAAAKTQAVMKLAEMASRRARQAIDALAAGLEQFGARTTGIGDQVARLTGQIEDEFARITGEKTIGDFDQFNPFENPAAASNQQIDAAISQLSELGTAPDSDVAFKDMAGLVKGQRDLPLIIRDTLNSLQMGRGADDEVSNIEVSQAIEKALSKKGINLPPQALSALTDTLKAGADRQTGQAFSMDALTKMLEKDGKVLSLLGEVAGIAATELSKAFEAMGQFKNSLLAVARLHQQMAKHRMESELSILDKQEAIRDRISNALGTGPDAFNQALTDLQKRMNIQVAGGVKPGEGTPFVGDVLNPDALFARLDTLDKKRTEVRGRMGQLEGQAMTQGTSSNAQELAQKMQDNSEELAKLNSEINGTEAALKELANDTRLLAAIESKISAQRARENTARGGFTALASGFSKLLSGEMSSKDFNEQVKRPLDIANKAFDENQALGIREGTQLLEGITGGDPIIQAKVQQKTEELAKQRGVSVDDVAGMASIRKEVVNNLIGNLAGAIEATADEMNMPNFGDEVRAMAENMFEAQSEQEKLGKIMSDVGNMQVSILQRTMDREQDKMATVLDKADAGFQKAATEFQAAVKEFALFRGGITDAEVQSVAAEVQQAEKELAKAEAGVAELVTGKVDPKTGETTFEKTDFAKEQIKKAGDEAAAAAQEKFGAQFKGDPAEVKRRVDDARQTAEAEATADQDRLIRDRRQNVTIKRNALTAKQDLHKRVQLTHDADKKNKQVRQEQQQQQAEEIQQPAPSDPARSGGGGGSGGWGDDDSQTGPKQKPKAQDPLSPASDTAAAVVVTEDSKQAAASPALSSIVQLLGEIKNCVCMGTVGKVWEAGKSAFGAGQSLYDTGKSSYASLIGADGTATQKKILKKKKKRVNGKVVTDEALPTASDIKKDAENKEGAAAGGCCSDVLVRMDTIIGLLGTGGPKSEAKDVAEKTAKAAEKEYKIGGETYVKGEGGRLQLKKKDEEAGTSTGLIDSLKKLTTGEMSVQDFNKLIPDLAQSIQASGTDDPAGFIANMFDNLSTNMKGVSDSLGLSEVAKMFDVGGGDNLKGVASNDVLKIDPATGRPMSHADIMKKKMDKSYAATATAVKGQDILEKIRVREQKKDAGETIAQINSGAMLRPGDTAGRLAGFRNAAIASPDLNIRRAGLGMNTGALSQEVQRQQTQQQVTKNIEAQKDSTDPRNAPVNPPVPTGDKTAAAGNVFEELRKTMEGKELAEKMSMVFETGGDYVAEKIMGAFKGAIPEKIEMTAQLGAITVQLVGGGVLEKWSEGVLEQMKQNITDGIKASVKESALIDSGRENSAGENL